MTERFDVRSAAYAQRWGRLCAARPWTITQGLLVVGLFGALIAALVVAPVATWTWVSYAAAVFFSLWMVLRLVCALLSWIANPQIAVSADALAQLSDAELPVYSILVPLYREPEVVTELLAAMRAIDYPADRLDLQFLLEPDDEETQAALRDAGLDPWMRITVAPTGAPRTKPRACNVALDQARGEFLVIFDAEDRPEPDQLKKAVAAYRTVDERVVCLQCRLMHYNAGQSIASRWAAVDYLAWFGWFLPGLQRIGGDLPLGGTSNHFRIAVLRELGGWDPFNVTEDADLGIRLGRHGYRTGMLDSVTWEEAVTRLPVWITQRSRWFKGYLQTWLVHQRGGVLRELGLRQYLLVQLLLLGTLISLLAAPIFWSVIVAWLGIGWSLVDIHSAWSRVGLVLSIALLAANLVWLVLNVVACVAARRMDLVPAALCSPVAWILHSFAAWRGAVQLLTRPFHWEKTKHGDAVEDTRGKRRGFMVVVATAILLAVLWQVVGLVGQRIEEDWVRQTPWTARQLPLPCPAAETPLLGSLSLSPADVRPDDSQAGEASWQVPLPAGDNVQVPLPWPSELHELRSVQCDLFVPPEAPQGMRVTMRIQDAGYRWYTWLHDQYLIPGKWTRVAFPLGLHDQWEGQGHVLAWHRSALRSARALDLQIHTAAEWQGDAVLANFRGDPFDLVDDDDGKWALRPERNNTIRAGAVTELRWRAPDWPTELQIEAILSKGDQRVTHTLFLAPDLEQGEVVSEPVLRLRHRFDEVGEWEIALSNHDSRLPMPPPLRVAVESGSSSEASAVNQSKDGLWRRADGQLHLVQQLSGSAANPMTELSAERVDAAQAAGAEYLRLWLTPWTDGLEVPRGWSADGLGGQGMFDPIAAAELDRRLDHAHERGVQVHLCVEPFVWAPAAAWAVHPYNQANGGTLAEPIAWSRDAGTRAAVLSKYRYVLARWGHHPAIGAWELHGLAGPAIERDQTFVTELTTLIARADPLQRPVIPNYVGLDASTSLLAELPSAAQTVNGLVRTHSGVSVDTTGTEPLAIVSGRGHMHDVEMNPRHPELHGAETLCVRMYQPPGAPAGSRAMLIAQDRDNYWWQYELAEPLAVANWSVLQFPLHADPNWRAIGHARTFQSYDVQHLQRLALRLTPPMATDMVAVLSKPAIVPRAPQALAFTDFTPGPDGLPTFAMWEASGALNRWHANPFDPEEVHLWMDVTGPDGATRRIDGFVHQDFHRELVKDRERLSAVGPLSWRFRYAAQVPGVYQFRIGGRDRNGTLENGPSGRFEAYRDGAALAGTQARGYIKRHPDKPRYLSFGDDGFYWPIGHNICQPVDLKQPYRYEFVVPPDQRSYTYDRFLTDMSAVGMTWGRVWMMPWNLGLEGPKEWHEYHGLGDYNLANAWRMDHVLEQARRHGIYLNLTVMHKSEIQGKAWPNCVYGAHHGGPMRDREAFYTTPEIMTAFKNRVRYIVARWGWDPAICAYELFGEANLVPGYDQAVAARWHKELITHLNALDHDRHLVFTHCHNWQVGHPLWALDEVDCVQGNGYIRPPNTTPDHTINFRRYISEVEQYNKPILVAEYGGRSEQEVRGRDYLEAQLHSGLWASAMADFAGSAMQWWWNFTEGIDGYRHYRPLADFVADMDRVAEEYSQLIIKVKSARELRCVGMVSRSSLYGWVYDTRIFEEYAQLPKITGARVVLPLQRAGIYNYQVIDCLSGRALDAGQREFTPGEVWALPTVHRDLAFKLRLVE